jgi:excisionase family DNA binding protein
MKPWVRKANRDEQQIALTSLDALAQSAQYLKKRSRQNVHLTVPGVEGQIEIPRKSFFLLKELIGHVAEGRSVTLVHSESEVTTQQAANMLNVSRPHLVKLLESGVIPFKRMKKHRRIALEDVVAYAARRQQGPELVMELNEK